MRKHLSSAWLIVALPLALLGAGCSSNGQPVANVAVPENGLLNGQIVGSPGYVFAEGDRLDLSLGSTASGTVRHVTVTKFLPRIIAAFSWESSPVGTQKNSTTGTVEDIDLLAPHGMALPFSWPKYASSLLRIRSGIWLSDDAYVELSKVKHTSLNLGLQDQPAIKAAATAQLKISDPDVVIGDAVFATTTLMVNDKATDLPVIQGKNWYGSFTVLNDRKNPLMLKFFLDPASDKVNKQGKEFLALREQVSFEVTGLQLSAK